MKKKAFFLNKYIGIFKGVKLPWILIILSLVLFYLEMDSQLQVATLTSAIIDASQNAINPSELVKYISMVAFTAVVSILSTYFIRKMEEVITLRIRTKLLGKIMRLPTKYYDEDNGDGLVSRVISDAAAPAGIFTLLVACIVCIVTTVQAFVQLFDYNETLASYSLLIIPLTLGISLLYGVLNFKIGIKLASSLSQSLGYLSERVRNFRLIKSAVAERPESTAGNRTFKEMYKADFANWMMIAGVQLGSGIFSIMFIFICFVIGGRLVKSGEMTIGDITGFYMITGIVGVQLMQLFMNVGSVAGTFGSVKQLAEILGTEEEPKGKENVPKLCGDIVFDNVTFGYGEDRDVLQNVSLRIPMGKVTAVIGGNGAGKSTLFKLITRMYQPSEGEIRFGDDDISKFRLDEWRDRFSYVFQNNPLIGGTVRENITYGLDREISDEELIQVTKRANCYDFIMEKPDGFDCDVGLGGSNFSGGQRQCISIARAMLRGSDYLLLDEATSNLDVVSEELVTDAMHALMKDKTTIMIAHNYAATRNADYILVMSNGTVEAFGTPEELSRTNEYYKIFSNHLLIG